MPVTSVHRLDAIDLPGSVKLAQISSQRVATNTQRLLDRAAGNVTPLFAGIVEQRPTIEVTTSQLATLLANVPLVGLALSSATYAYFKLGASTGSVARATTSHTRVAINKGHAHWTRINLPHNGQGTADVVLTAVYDGTNDPLVIAGSTALNGSLSSDEHFTCGPVYLNDVRLGSIQNISIDSGLTLLVKSSDGEVWPTLVGVEMSEPVVTITTDLVSPLASLGIEGTALDGTDGLVFYARKMTKNQAGGVARVAIATEEHISFTGLTGHYTVEEVGGQGNDPLQTQIRVQLTGDTPLTIDTTAAIPE